MDNESFVKFMNDIGDDKKCFLMNVYAIYKGCKGLYISKEVNSIVNVGKYIKKWNSSDLDNFIVSLRRADQSAVIIEHQILNGADQDAFGVSEELFNLLKDVVRNSRFNSIADYMECEFSTEDTEADIWFNNVAEHMENKSFRTVDTLEYSQKLENVNRLVDITKKELNIFITQFDEVIETSLYLILDPEGIQKFKTECSSLCKLLADLASDSEKGLIQYNYDKQLAEYCNGIKKARYEWQLGNIDKNILDRLFMIIDVIGCKDRAVLRELEMRRAAYGTAEWDKEVKG